jgi:predicted MPP superfamily phosphohydrolase
MSKTNRPSGKFLRAKARHVLFAAGPNKLSRGRLFKKHFDQSIDLKKVEITSPSWPSAFDGLRIGHVSDFHLGDLMPLDRALGAIDTLVSQEPDIVVCTGDVVDLHVNGALPLLEALANIGAPLGTMLVLGNHDELDCASALSSMAQSSGVRLLRDASCQIHHNGNALTVAGIDWAKTSKQCKSKVEKVCDDQTHILLSHNPKAFTTASEVGVPLTLSGHTHGGQVAMPNRRGANLAVAHRYTAGVYERGDSRLFVTVGVGAWFPLRINCPAEVALITATSSS